MKKHKIPQKLQIWIDVRQRYHLSHAHIAMARELGLNPKKIGKLANHRQESWKLPLPAYIEKLYQKRFRKARPDVVTSIEAVVKARRKRQALRKQHKLYRKILHQHDDQNASTCSIDVDDTAVERTTREIAMALEQKFQHTVSWNKEACNHDASFRIAIALQQESAEHGVSRCDLWFSHVGNLATLTTPNILDPDVCRTILSILEKSGFDYIPADVLEKPYDGVMSEEFGTWRQRYFG